MMDVTEIAGCEFSDLHCISCENFLSVTPILMDAHGNNICGRCETRISRDLYIRNVRYEKLACHFNFPCKFENEGCVKKVNFSEMRVHEATCPYQIIKCQIKNCVWLGTPTELIIHYQISHLDLIIESDCVQKLLEDDGYFMLAVNGIYFLMEWSYQKFIFSLNIRCLDILDLDDEVLFKYTLTSINSTKPLNIVNVLKLNDHITMCNVDLGIERPSMISPILFSINAELPISIINKKANDLMKIICPNCSVQMIPPILKCPMGHLTCVDCSGCNYDWCGICQDGVVHCSRASELEHIAVNALYTCKWEGCGSNFSLREIQAHQQECPKRIYTCFYCPQWNGLRDEILPHNMVCANTKGEWSIATNTQVTFMGTTIDNVEYILIAHNDIFWILIETYNGGTEVAVCNCGPSSLYGWYRYEAELQHTEDLNFPFNKSYNLKYKRNSQFFIKIPSTDMDKFGGREFFKITVKIILLQGSNRTSYIFY